MDKVSERSGRRAPARATSQKCTWSHDASYYIIIEIPCLLPILHHVWSIKSLQSADAIFFAHPPSREHHFLALPEKRWQHIGKMQALVSICCVVVAFFGLCCATGRCCEHFFVSPPALCWSCSSFEPAIIKQTNKQGGRRLVMFIAII